jgi:hypothetical protein
MPLTFNTPQPTGVRSKSDPLLDAALANDLANVDYATLPVGAGTVLTLTVPKSRAASAKAACNARTEALRIMRDTASVAGVTDAKGVYPDGSYLGTSDAKAVLNADGTAWTVTVWVGRRKAA